MFTLFHNFIYFREMHPYLNLQSEKVMRQQLNGITSVAVKDVDMLFPSNISESVDGFQSKVTPVAYIPQLTQFVLGYLERIQRYIKQI